jgi:hypothetical protein
VDSGGLLVVLGQPNTAWMASFDAAFAFPAALASGPLRAGSDPGHPLRTVPNALASAGYATGGADLATPRAARFAVAQRDAALAPLLSVSRAGAYGGGTVVLAATCGAMPASGTCATPASTDCKGESREGCLLLHNLLVQRFAPLFLDYGPVVSAPAGTASGQALVCLSNGAPAGTPACGGDATLEAASDLRVREAVFATLTVYVFH